MGLERCIPANVFLFKQKTAYEIEYGLVGAEMCIRDRPKTVLVYDLGGGTFDVSVVHAAGDLTEVLASHGDTHLGGDDFDQLLLEHLHRQPLSGGGPEPHGDRRARGPPAPRGPFFYTRPDTAETAGRTLGRRVI